MSKNVAHRVAVWSTGWIGTIAIRAAHRRADMELVGVWVHSPEKEGRDAGELAGMRADRVAADQRRRRDPRRTTGLRDLRGQRPPARRRRGARLRAPARSRCERGDRHFVVAGVPVGVRAHVGSRRSPRRPSAVARRCTRRASNRASRPTNSRWCSRRCRTRSDRCGPPRSCSTTAIRSSTCCARWASASRSTRRRSWRCRRADRHLGSLDPPRGRRSRRGDRGDPRVLRPCADGPPPRGGLRGDRSRDRGAVRTQTVGVVDGRECIVIEHVNRMAPDLAPEWPTGARGVDGIYTIHLGAIPTSTWR